MAKRLMEELGWQTQLQCPEVPEILSLFSARSRKTYPLGWGLLASAGLILGPFLYRFRFPTTPAMSPCPWPMRCCTSPVLVSWGPSRASAKGGGQLGMTTNKGLFTNTNSFHFKN